MFEIITIRNEIDHANQIKKEKMFQHQQQTRANNNKGGFITAYEYDIANRIEKLKMYTYYIGSAKV